MPAPRLPWIKFWPEALEHEKFADLTDAESWTWVVVWAKASLQPTRWRFASVAHAAKISGRPKKFISKLISVGLLDLQETGLWVHDWQQWQSAATISKSGREGWSNDGRKVVERPANGGLEVDREKERENVAAAAVVTPESPAPRRRTRGGGGLRRLNGFLPETATASATFADLPDEVRERLRQPPIGANHADG